MGIINEFLFDIVFILSDPIKGGKEKNTPGPLLPPTKPSRFSKAAVQSFMYVFFIMDYACVSTLLMGQTAKITGSPYMVHVTASKERLSLRWVLCGNDEAIYILHASGRGTFYKKILLLSNNGL